MIKSNPVTDVIVTWVDGADPTHIEKRTRALNDPQSKAWHILPAGQARHRFSDNGELRYCLFSIRKFMPWIRHIYLVTDDQHPSFLTHEVKERLGVKIIHHPHIFRGHQETLPTFNSRSIETAIHRIEGLAETYLYFNDDVLVLKPTPQSEFFQDRKVVIRGKWEPLRDYGPIRLALGAGLNKFYAKLDLRERSMALLPQYRAAKLAGCSTQFIRAPHVPHPVTTSTLRDFFEIHPDKFRENIQHRFRSMLQFVAHPLAAHLEIKNNNYIPSRTNDYIMLNFAKSDSISMEVDALISREYKFACLQGLEYANADKKNKVTRFLEERIFE